MNGKRNSFNKKHKTVAYTINSIFFWVLLIPFKILDILGVFYLFNFIRNLVIKNRKLTELEIQELQLVFGDRLNYNGIRIIEDSYFAKVGAKSAKKSSMGFVLFNTINFSRKLNHSKNTSDMPWLVHEAVHTLQFKHLGVQYILEALRAQRNGGYNYGGVRQLQNVDRLDTFNLEQQADVAKDFYKFTKSNSNFANIYLPFIGQIKRGAF